jgi:predicted phage replisome organizer
MQTDGKRFYWLRLKKDFFQQHQIKVLKALPNGRLYALIYLELLAESTSHDGELRFSKMLPYDTVTLASVLDEDKDNLEKAIETLERLELVDILDDGTIYMTEIQKLIGSETGSAQRKREYRQKIGQGTMSQKCLLENRDKRLEKRDKNIYPTLDEVRAYCQERKNNVDPEKFYEYYSVADWKDSKGNKVKNWKQKMIVNWEKKAETSKRTDIVPQYDENENPQFDEERFNEIMKRRNK